MQFNILVTTYETIMRDRSKLSKLEWKYIIIDEAQRMKDRESKLSQDLNKFTTARRLLLTGTPLQNELKELWSLLNLLLPDVSSIKLIISNTNPLYSVVPAAVCYNGQCWVKVG